MSSSLAHRPLAKNGFMVFIDAKMPGSKMGKSPRLKLRAFWQCRFFFWHLVLGPLRGQSGPPRFSCFSPEPYHCLRRVPGGLTGSFSVICLTGFWLDPRGGVARNGRKWLPGIEGAGNFLGFFNQNPLTFGHFDPMAKSDPPQGVRSG